MKSISKKVLLLYFIMILYVVVSSLLLSKGINIHYNYFVNPLAWMILFIVSFFITYSEQRRLKAKTEKTQTVLIITMIYLVIYFILGLFFGYTKSPYSHTILSIFKNIWGFVTIIFFQEYVRESMLPLGKKKFIWYVIIIVFFSCAEINFYNFSTNFVNLEKGFQFICTMLVPIFVRNILFTYLSAVGGYGCNLSYRIPIILTNLIMPLFPDLVWFVGAIIDLLVPFVVFLSINYIQERKILRDSRKQIRKHNPVRQAPFIICLLLFVAFVSGVFTYMPVAIMSNSMSDLIKRGDVVVVQKIKQEEIKKLKINDIIEYKLDNYSVVHRIIEIKKTSDGLVFTTKGDHNNVKDLKPVTPDQIVSIVRLKIPKIGYPAVLLSELFSKKNVGVET